MKDIKEIKYEDYNYLKNDDDVSAVDVIPGAEKQSVDNFYYRTSIEKALQLGLLHKDSDDLFKPTSTITVGEYAKAVEKAFGLTDGALINYEKTAAELAEDDSIRTAAAEPRLGVAAEPKVGIAAEGAAITVSQPTGGTITVYNDSAFSRITADIPANAAAEQVISDNEHFKLTAPPNIAAGSDKNGVFADNAGISGNYVEFRKSGSDAAPFKTAVYTAKADGILTVYARAGGNKKITLEGKTKQEKYINDGDGTDSANIYGTVTFSVSAGNEYTLYTAGGTGRLFGVKYESTDYPQSTEQLMVSNGDKVRVVVVPDSGYVIDHITVDGEKATSGREYTFTANESVTVSAVLTAEPEIVETTIVAADAPLTREVMGAILYDAYQKAGKTNIAKYMAQNGGVPTPDDPNYDPNIKYEGSPYIPITGWGALTDKEGLNNALYAKVKAAYNLGLIRPETGIARGSISLGTELEPTAEVTRAKAAKSLVFAFILTQPQSGESQTVPEGFAPVEPAEIALPTMGLVPSVYTK